MRFDLRSSKLVRRNNIWQIQLFPKIVPHNFRGTVTSSSSNHRGYPHPWCERPYLCWRRRLDSRTPDVPARVAASGAPLWRWLAWWRTPWSRPRSWATCGWRCSLAPPSHCGWAAPWSSGAVCKQPQTLVFVLMSGTHIKVRVQSSPSWPQYEGWTLWRWLVSWVRDRSQAV